MVPNRMERRRHHDAVYWFDLNKCARQRTGIEVDCVQLSVLRNIKDPKAAELTCGLGKKKEMTQET